MEKYCGSAGNGRMNSQIEMSEKWPRLRMLLQTTWELFVQKPKLPKDGCNETKHHTLLRKRKTKTLCWKYFGVLFKNVNVLWQAHFFIYNVKKSPFSEHRGAQRSFFFLDQLLNFDTNFTFSLIFLKASAIEKPSPSLHHREQPLAQSNIGRSSKQ